MNDNSHLDPNVEPMLELPRHERAALMLGEKFIQHDRLKPILEHVEFLLRRPPETRAAGLIVSGAPGSGKTMIANWLKKKFSPTPSGNGQPAQMPVLGISMTGAREAKILFNRSLEQLGVPEINRYTMSDRERMVLKVCRTANVRLLVLDELQDVLSSTPRQQRIALDTIKLLMNELMVPILALGTSQAPTAMQVDEHLNARFDHRTLPIWKREPELANLLCALERMLPLAEPSQLASLPLTAKLLSLSGGVLGRMMRLVCHAGAHALEEGKERIDVLCLERAAREVPIAAVRKASEAMSMGQKAA